MAENHTSIVTCPSYLTRTECASRLLRSMVLQPSWSAILFDIASGFIRIFSQVSHKCKELLRLAQEESHGGEKLEGSHGSPLCASGTNDGACRELPAEKYSGFRHDQVGLEILTPGRRHVEVGKYQRMILGVGQSRSIAGLVLPRLKVHGLGWADAEHDAQNLDIGYPLSQRWIEAGPTLLDGAKVEHSRVG